MSEKQHLSPEQIKDLVHDSGTELTEEELEKISGGWNTTKHCPPGQHDYQYKGLQPSSTASGVFRLYGHLETHCLQLMQVSIFFISSCQWSLVQAAVGALLKRRDILAQLLIRIPLGQGMQ